MLSALAIAALSPGEAAANVDICQELVEDLLIPPTFEEVVTCDNDPMVCLFAPHCCVPGLCAVDPICTATQYVPVAAQAFQAGEVVCGLEMDSQEFVERLQNGLITNVVDLSLGGLPGHLAAAVEATVFGMTLRGTPVPPAAASILAELTEPFADDERLFDSLDLAQARVLPASDVDAGAFLPAAADGITLGNLVIVRQEVYDALYDIPGGVVLDDFIVGDVPLEYAWAVQVILHELVHVRQYREDGMQTFWTDYLLEAAIAQAAVGLDPRELEAYSFGADVDEFHGGWPCRASEDLHNGILAGYRPPVDCYTNNEADPLVDGALIEGKLEQPGSDVFSLELEAGERLEVELKTFVLLGDLDLFVHDPAGDLVTSSESNTDFEFIEFTASMSGSYSIVVTSPDNTSAPYDLDVTIESSQSGWFPGPIFTKK